MRINIALTGRPQSGKSSLLACMYEAVRESERGKFLMPNPQEAGSLTNIYDELRNNASGKSDFTVKINTHSESGSNLIKLQCKGSEAEFLFKFNDTQDANIFIAVIDAPLFMEKFYEESGLPEAVKIFTESLESSKENKMLLIVPVKSEKYKHEDIISKIAGHESLSELIKLSQNKGKYSGRSVVAVLPVQTMGNMIFKNFTQTNGAIESENFTSKPGAEFKPEYADQVFRLVMQFLMSEMTNKRDNALENIFSSKEIRDTAFHIAQGANNGLYRCLCGASLLEIKPEVRKSFAKMFFMIGFPVVIAAVVFAYISGLRADKSSLYNELAEQRVLTRQHEQKISELEKSLSRANSSLSLEQDRAKSAEDELKGERTLTDELRQKISELEKSLTNANSSLESEQAKNKAAEKRISNLNNMITIFNNDNTNLQAELSRTRKELETASKRINTLHKEGDITLADRNNLEQRLKAAQSELSNLTKRNNDLNSTLQKLRKDYDELKKKYDRRWF